MSRRQQHAKGKKRPGYWHQGRAQGRINDRLLVEHEQVEQRAAEEAATVAAEAQQLAAEVRERGAMIGALRHVQPFVPDWWPA